jgi:hypothetical protein
VVQEEPAEAVTPMTQVIVCSRCQKVIQPGARGPIWTLGQHWEIYHQGVPRKRPRPATTVRQEVPDFPPDWVLEGSLGRLTIYAPRKGA